jgi:prepilin-type N-terminal cleavage/methylation domain-containing protein
MKDRSYRTRTSDAGFTIIEILVVLGIIATMAAVALPAIGRYIRVYQIQGATQQVASEVQAARVKAIARNVNSGVAFYIYDRNRYWWAMEDLPSPTAPPSPTSCPSPGTTGAAWQAPLPITECVALHGAFETLPSGIEFDTAPPVGTPNDCKFWFTRLGMYQSARPGPIPSPTPACSGSFLTTTAGNASITVKQSSTGLHGRIDINSGGRVQVVRTWQ